PKAGASVSDAEARRPTTQVPAPVPTEWVVPQDEGAHSARRYVPIAIGAAVLLAAVGVVIAVRAPEVTPPAAVVVATPPPTPKPVTPAPPPEVVAAPVVVTPPPPAVETPPPPVVEDAPVKPSAPVAKNVTVKTVRADTSAPSKGGDSVSEKALKAQILALADEIRASPLYANDKRHKGLSQQTALNTVDRFITLLENAEGAQDRALILKDLREWKANYLRK
ncbi:serine/threonine protein kinase, partial [Corallococcus praedator]